MTKQLKLGAFVLAMAVSSTAMAYNENQEIPGYTQSEQSGAIVRNNYNECWQTGSWTADKLVQECGGRAAPAPKVGGPVVSEPVINKKEFNISADVLFAFDSAKLSPAGKAILDREILGKLQGMNVTDITVAGHTDFKGSDAYNQALSERRARSVEKYLSRSINPSAIQSRGYGESQQTMKDTCEQQTAGIANARKRRLKLIECIQPDRRVNVGVHYVD